jgi:hypothetical protein
MLKNSRARQAEREKNSKEPKKQLTTEELKKDPGKASRNLKETLSHFQAGTPVKKALKNI